MPPSRLKANVGFLGSVPFLTPSGDEERSDYRPVPASDRGNDGYRDRGMLGSYTPDAEPYSAPSDVHYELGYGVSAADAERGYADPLITDAPAYDLGDYKNRSSQPRLSDDDEGGDAMENDYQFQRRNERSRGFLTRPHIPTER